MKSWYLSLTIACLALFALPQADASDIYTKTWKGINYDSIGGDYLDPDPAHGTPWICLAHTGHGAGAAVYKFDHTGMPLPGLNKFTVRVHGYDDGGGLGTAKFGLFDFQAKDVVYLGRGLPAIEQWVSGSVTTSLDRFSNASDEILVAIVAEPDQHGHIRTVELEIEYNCYPPGIPSAPETYAGTPCADQDFYVRWNSVPEATKYRLYEDGIELYEGPDTSTWPPDFYTRPAGDYSYTVSAGNDYGWSDQGPPYEATVLTTAGVPEHIYLPPGDQCDAEPFETGWSSATDTWRYTLYIDEVNPPISQQEYILSPDTTVELTLAPGKYYFQVKANAWDGCSAGRGPLDSVTVNPIPTAPEWTSSGMNNICQGGIYYLYWAAIPEATQYRVFENGVICGTFGSTTTRVGRYHDEGGEWEYWMQAAVGNCWSGDSDTITVTMRYEAPPPAPSQPSASPATVCPNSTYTVSWPPVAGAVIYRLYENSTNIYHGAGLSTACTNDPGSYEYFVQAYDGECYGHFSDKLNLEIPAPMAMPDAIVAPDYVVLLDEEYVVAWSTVSGADYYELYEDGGWILNAVDTQVTLSHDTPGDYVYSVAACDDCSCGDLISASPVQVEEETDVREIPSEALPVEFTLSQNYPNPFNPVTNIDFALPRAAHVRVEIFNILGGKVCTLVDEYLSPGYKSVEWDGSSNSGQAAASGIYLFRITAGEYSACRKALLMK